MKPSIAEFPGGAAVAFGSLGVVIRHLGGDKIEVRVFDIKNDVLLSEEIYHDPDQEPQIP